MIKTKIFLETTLFNYYFDTDRDAHADTVKLFKDIAAGKYGAYTSDAVLEELDKAPEPKRSMMLALLKTHNISMLPVSDEAKKLADIYIAGGIIPIKYKTDAIHIAVATVNELEIIISMNFQHIVSLKTQHMTSVANKLNGYLPVEIISPMEIANHEKT